MHRAQKRKKILKTKLTPPLLGATHVKAEHKYVGEIRAQLHQHSTYRFYMHRAQKGKKILTT